MSHLNKKVLGAGAAVVALSSFVPNPFMMGDALAQATATDTMNISASVVNPLSVTEATKLNFGAFAVSATSGTLTFNTGTNTIANGVVITAGTLGKVTFNAPQNATFTVSVPDFSGTSAIVLKNGGGTMSSQTMKVTQLTYAVTNTTKMTFNVNSEATHQFNSGKVTEQGKIKAAGGTAQASIGGTLLFKPNQVTGGYSGTYTLLMTF